MATMTVDGNRIIISESDDAEHADQIETGVGMLLEGTRLICKTLKVHPLELVFNTLFTLMMTHKKPDVSAADAIDPILNMLQEIKGHAAEIDSLIEAANMTGTHEAGRA